MNIIKLGFFLLVSLPFSNGQLSASVELEISEKTFFGGLSTVSGPLPADPTDFILLTPSNKALRDGCNSVDLPAPDLEKLGNVKIGLLLDNMVNEKKKAEPEDPTFCNRTTQGKLATAFNVDFLLIGSNTEALLQNSSDANSRLSNPCFVDCDISNDKNEDTCAESSACESNVCTLGFLEEDVDSKTFCCAIDDFINLGPNVSIPAISLKIQDTNEIIENIMSISADENYLSVNANVKERARFSVDPVIVILLGIGTLTTLLATYVASDDDRRGISFVWGGKSEPFYEKYVRHFAKLAEEKRKKEEEALELRGGGDEDKEKSSESNVEELEAVDLSTGQGLMLIACACIGLVSIFFLVRIYPTEVVIASVVFFGIGSAYATSYFFIRPLLRLILPKKIKFHKVYTPKKLHYFIDPFFTVEAIIGYFIAMTLVIIWILFRHDKEYVWFLQNFFSIAMACLFLSTLRVTTLMTNVVVLIGFCIYDIFMVFITPFFGREGQSVMLVVATAGSVADTFGDNDLTCTRVEDEQMPMLFLAPRFDFVGGFGILGLGDVLLPGLLITYILRVDYLVARMKAIEIYVKTGEHMVGPKHLSVVSFLKAHYFWISSLVAYLAALITTFIANSQGWTINGVPAQPALLYIVPFLLIMFMTQVACHRRVSNRMLWSKGLASFTDASIDKMYRGEPEEDIEDKSVEMKAKKALSTDEGKRTVMAEDIPTGVVVINEETIEGSAIGDADKDEVDKAVSI